jgi:hypothetical protein
MVWVHGMGPWYGSMVWVHGVGPWCGSMVWVHGVGPVRNRFQITGDSSSQYLNLCGESARFGSLAVRVGGYSSIPELTEYI